MADSPMATRKRPRAGPLISAEVIEAVAQSLLEGNYFVVACEASGISRRTGDRWLQRGERAEDEPDIDPDGLYREFRDRVVQAEAASEQDYVKSIHTVAKKEAAEGGDWKASAFILERRHPDRWGRIERIAMQHRGIVGITVDEEQIARLNDDELDRLEGALDVAAGILGRGEEDRDASDPGETGTG